MPLRSAAAATLVPLAAFALAATAQSSAHLTIDPAQTLHPVSPTLYGLMTEEINHSYEGGLYAELLQNRTFRPEWFGLENWALVRRGTADAKFEVVKDDGPSLALHTSVKMTITQAAPGNEAGLVNTGFWGIALKPGTAYHGSLYAHADGVRTLTARLVSDNTGEVLASANVALSGSGWQPYSYTLTTNGNAKGSTNHFEILAAEPGTVSLQLVSLMPPTYKDTPNGNRIDLMEKLAAMHPHFLRLPGGNALEGDTLKDWYNWKTTIGPLVDRPGHQAPWSYWSTDGLGLLEYLEWCEDLNMEPVLAVYAGYSLKGEYIDAGPALEPYVQSALDEVEYVTGDTSTKWGAERAKDGHPAPFPLHYIEIGNEDEFDRSKSYDGRFAQFAEALHKRYPQYKLIATTPVKENAPGAQPDMIDDHYYKSTADMLDFAHHYDNAPRTGPKVFVGEWATLSGHPTPDWGGALADAAWMTGMERNSDLILISSYAPLLTNVNPNASQWPTNLIGYNADESYGSPSYYAQVLFATHLGDAVPQSTLSGAGARFYYSATTGGGSLHLKLVNASSDPQPLTLDIAGAHAGKAQLTTLRAASYQATNSIDHPTEIAPQTTTATLASSHTVPPMTIEVWDIPLK